MERKLDLKKGDKCIVAIERGSNSSRYQNMSIENIDKWTYEGEVISSGSKYIGVKFGHREEKFEIDMDYRQKYIAGGADYKLYKDLQEVYDERESEELESKIRLYFSGYNRKNISLDNLRKINEILNSEEK